VILLDSDGHRLLAKYFDPPHIGNPSANNNESNKKNSSSHGLTHLGFSGFGSQLRTLKDQRAFEHTIWDKTRKSTGMLHFYSLACNFFQKKYFLREGKYTYQVVYLRR
jgi:hypothetical protein